MKSEMARQKVMPRKLALQKNLKRCPWPSADDLLYLKYHDQEWGVPVRNDRKLYEFLVLETFQAGLSWRTVLHKRKAFEKAFANFDPRKVAKFSGRDIGRLMSNPAIIRNRLKIQAAIANAREFLKIQKEFGTFSKYMWSWVGGRPVVHNIRSIKGYKPFDTNAIAWAKDLKKRGFKFLGPTVVYSHMQAVGMVNDHLVGCFRHPANSRTHGPRQG